MNDRELVICAKYRNLGFDYLHKGWPDFLFFKDDEVIFVEVKRKQKHITEKMGLSAHQRQVSEIFKSLGLTVKVEYV